MGGFDPDFYQSTKLLSPMEKFSRFRRSSDLHARVVDHIPFAAAGVEEQHQGIYLFPSAMPAHSKLRA
jgi:hypothetical protein